MEHLTAAGSVGGSSIDCAADPVGSLVRMFVEMVQKGRIAKGQSPALRPVFLKPHGVAAAEFRILPTLPTELQVGLFAAPGATFPAYVRFSSDTLPTLGDFASTLGIGIKLFDVGGDKLSGDPADRTFDLILQNAEVFFVDTAADMCAFTKAGVVDGDYGPYLAQHPKTKALLDAMERPVASTLSETYWSCLPFKFGTGGFAKYKLEPDLALPAPTTAPNDPSYLAADLGERLKAGEARFKFMVQLRTDPAAMPLDEATAAWPEKLSEPVHVADLVIPIQDVTARGQATYGENLAMDIWRVTEDHEPVGSIADVRRAVYAASAQQRRNVNGIPLGEPSSPRPIMATPAAVDRVIVRAAIHPGIGIARIGDSKSEYFIGPETVTPLNADKYRDASGAIKRQGARFRLYGFNAAGEVVRELTPDNADIVWTAHLANRKAQWFQFQYALDIPEAVNAPDNQFPLRNRKVADRTTLAIDPGPRSISGRNTAGGAHHSFDTGAFQAAAKKPVTVPLGEIRTDEDGRLIVLGGTGASASPTNAPVFEPAKPPTFNNADDWYDDTADGPVTATVSIGGKPIPVEAAWVVVAPPNYAPGVLSWRTMYDLMCDVYVQAGWMTMPATPSFSRDILPILSRLTGLQWVNKGFAAFFGKGGPMDFTDPELIAKLAHQTAGPPGDDPYAELRLAILHNFRPAKPVVAEPVSWPHIWPWIYGDAFGSFSETGTGNMLPMTGLQEGLLRNWAAGHFIADWPEQVSPAVFDAVPLQDQPGMLDRAALDYCLADTFHPGCEMTWPMRHASLYTAPFRIRARPADQPEPNFGEVLTPITVAAVDGPLYAQPPGGLTRWMAIPWQGDTAFCRSGYNPDFDPYLPTFWAARVPNQVLTSEDYAIVMDTSLPREKRLAAYQRRESWLRAIENASTPQVMMQMITHFGELGIVEARPGIKGDPDFPEIIHVESLVTGKLKKGALKATALLAKLDRPRSRLEKAGWASHEQLEAFRAVRVRKS